MAEAPIMPFATDAYLADTTHFTTIEHGAYMLLLMTMWRAGGSLPSDAKTLAKYTRLSPRQFERIWPTLEPLFHVEDDHIWHGKLQDFLVAVRQKSVKASNSARAKWRKTKETGDANAPPKQCERNAIHKPKVKREAKASPKKAPDKGSRLPENWELNRADGEWAVSQGMAEERVRFEADKFRDYWLGVPGAKGRKVDWASTWRNWIRKALDDAPRAPSQKTGGSNDRFAAAMADAERASRRTETGHGMVDCPGDVVPGPLFPAERKRGGIQDANGGLARGFGRPSPGGDRESDNGAQTIDGQIDAEAWRDEDFGSVLHFAGRAANF